MALLESNVPIREVVTTDPEKAKALENDVRAKILDMLAAEELMIEEIHDELHRRGEEKAETTVRHHVNVLKDAGMVEIARLEEAGGGTRKYYKSNTRIFSYELPEDAEQTLAGAQDTATAELAGLVERLYGEHGDDIEAVAREMKPCEYCATQHYEEFVLRELLNRALIDLTENGTVESVRRDSEDAGDEAESHDDEDGR
ncbi:winged helix-turn-helix domain-containing protein [Halomicroarcula sp. S1AR25-4]|jgi:DNA-binding transcriptional ArsR family regulator|uniref:ArsR/SmtB family transcription factor n=1 Tax=Haloarcula TaxID=2237 RepID=UPI0021C68BCB|nr:MULTISPECIES: winged helix-turn-helix domain-containing protein [Halomicroarcula]MDS0280187.1 winged helix-turn-helix domain-containing protein [Halomicroarcula sp. S1AR25-4]